ncbi:MAG TPA: alpha/beta hydrolase [Acidimicrobiales bacterium]|nr:alpha/beta hydrolase [Acidimicrobiales bacterium]
MPRQQLDTGVSLYYEWHGPDAGVPVVFIRGTGADSSRWMPQVRDYSQHYRCLIFDNRGCGKSGTTAGQYTVASMAEDTLALLGSLGVDRAHIVGLSLGGAIAQHLAVERPELVATLQLHGTWGKTDGYAERYFALAAQLLDAGGMSLYYSTTIMFLFPPDFFTEQPEAAARILADMEENASPIEGMRGQLHANRTHDCLERLNEIAVPTLITVGELDMCLPPSYSRQLHERIPSSELVVFPGGSHLFGLQDPATFNRVTLGWLEKHDQRS